MLKKCGDAIDKLLEMIFRQALLAGAFPSEWWKGNIAPVPKKVTSKILKIIVQFSASDLR